MTHIPQYVPMMMPPVEPDSDDFPGLPPDRGWPWWLIILALVVGAWVVLTLLHWLSSVGCGDDVTLLDVLKSQWRFVTRLRIW